MASDGSQPRQHKASAHSPGDHSPVPKLARPSIHLGASGHSRLHQPESFPVPGLERSINISGDDS